MNEEEKEAILELKHFSNITTYWKLEEYTNSQIDSYIKIVLNLIDKQQKEISRLQKNSISKDKIREKIKELKEKGNYRDIYNPTGRVHFMKEETDYQIQVLYELLGE